MVIEGGHLTYTTTMVRTTHKTKRLNNAEPPYLNKYHELVLTRGQRNSRYCRHSLSHVLLSSWLTRGVVALSPCLALSVGRCLGKRERETPPFQPCLGTRYRSEEGSHRLEDSSDGPRPGPSRVSYFHAQNSSFYGGKMRT